MLQPRLQCSSDSPALHTREVGVVGAPHAVLSLLVVLSLLCQQCFCPVRPLQPAPSPPGMGDGARRIHTTFRDRQRLRNAPAASLPCLLQVFSREELGLIAELCVKHDVLCISDEVYEWLVYDGKRHIRIGTGWAGPGWAGQGMGVSLANHRKSHWKSQELPACTA